MKLRKYAIAAAAVMGMTGASAYADPFYVSNVSVPSGEYNVTVNGAPNNIYYAGLIEFTGTYHGSPTTLDVFCDDLYNDVYIGSSDQYYTANANTYLAPVASTAVIHEIAGLAYYGISNYNPANPAASAATNAEVQLAIWDLEYGIAPTDSTLFADVNNLIAGASTDYAAMVSQGYSYGQLVDPCSGQSPDGVTANSCQTQGQIYITGGGAGVNLVPEPLTLSLFGAGLAGAAGAFRRRRKAKSSAA